MIAVSDDPLAATLGPILALGRILESQPGSLEAILGGVGKSAEQLVTTVPTQLIGAAESLTSVQLAAAVNTLMSVPVAVLNPVLALNLELAAVVIGLAGPAFSTVGATVEAIQLVIDAADEGDPQKTLDAVLDGPAVLADGVFNGGYGPDVAAHPNTDPLTLAGEFLAGELSGMTDRVFLTVPLPRLRILASRRWCRPGRLEARKPHPSGNLERESHQARRIHRRPDRRQKGVARNDLLQVRPPGQGRSQGGPRARQDVGQEVR